MTREEAIRHIMDVIAENNSIKPNIVTFEQEKEALYMAIEALSADAVQGDPSAEAVEVVRCKDCKHRRNICSMRYIEMVGEDERIHDYSTDNGYCSWGERKGGDDE